MAKRKSAKSGYRSVDFTTHRQNFVDREKDAETDPLYQAFVDYWHHIAAGKTKTEAAIDAIADHNLGGIDGIDAVHFRRLAKKHVTGPLDVQFAAIANSKKENRDFKMIEWIVRGSSKLPVDTWEEFEAAYHDSGIGDVPHLLDVVKLYLMRVGYKRAKKD